MLSKSKSQKSSKPVKSSNPKAHFLLGEKVVFWILIMMTIALVTALFGDMNVRTLKSGEKPSVLANSGATTFVADVKETDNAANKSAGGRILITPSVPVDNACELEWNDDPANALVAWRDTSTGVTANIPYNINWGNDKYLFAPIERDGSFGPGEPGGACGLGRDSRLTIENPDTVDGNGPISPKKLLEEIRADEPPAENIRERTIGGISVISAVRGELGRGPHWYVFGRSYFYTIESQGWLTDAEAIKIIQSLRVSK